LQLLPKTGHPAKPTTAAAALWGARIAAMLVLPLIQLAAAAADPHHNLTRPSHQWQVLDLLLLWILLLVLSKEQGLPGALRLLDL
jgi:uncharacterized integral membrane protein